MKWKWSSIVEIGGIKLLMIQEEFLFVCYSYFMLRNLRNTGTILLHQAAIRKCSLKKYFLFLPHDKLENLLVYPSRRCDSIANRFRFVVGTVGGRDRSYSVFPIVFHTTYWATTKYPICNETHVANRKPL